MFLIYYILMMAFTVFNLGVLNGIQFLIWIGFVHTVTGLFYFIEYKWKG